MAKWFENAPVWLTPNMFIWLLLLVVAYIVLFVLGRKIWRFKRAPRIAETIHVEAEDSQGDADEPPSAPHQSNPIQMWIEKLQQQKDAPPDMAKLQKRFVVWLVLALGGHFMLVQELLK